VGIRVAERWKNGLIQGNNSLSYASIAWLWKAYYPINSKTKPKKKIRGHQSIETLMSPVSAA
jgi:hypothetical protein